MSQSGNGKKTSVTTIRPSEDGTYRLLVDSLRDYAIFILDPAGRVLTWNEGARAMKGYAPEEIIGSHFSRFYPRDQIDRGWPEHELARAAETGRCEDEGWRVRKDGSQFWASVIITALRNENGELIGFSKITRDLTEQRQHAEALRLSGERFRVLVEGVNDYGIFMLDTRGFVTTWNSGAEQIKGYKAGEIIGCHFSRFYPAEAIKRRWPEHELHVAAIEGRFEDEGWRIRKDGSRFWANVVITALRDPSGALMGFSKITRDLTERRRNEQALAESEQRFRLLVEGVNEYAIVMLDRNGFVSSWNKGAERISGYAAREILGKHFSHFYTSEDVADDKPWQHLAHARDSGRDTDENWRVRKDGSLYWASSIITPLHNAEGQLYGFAQVTQDLTQRRHAETLADTARRMHEFIAMLAHELRNPLAPIRNAVQLMGKKGLGDPALESMRQMIERQSAYLTRIVDELLDVNRIARGKFAIEREAVELKDVLARAIETSRPLIDAQGHRLSVDVPAEAMPLRGDSLRLTQAVVNLLNNAAKYTPHGGDIRLTAEKRAADIEIRVADTGKGIEPDDLDKVFDLFTQVGSSPAGDLGGLGVGLALVRRIVELHAGSVKARSAGPGKGSEFIVRLPLPVQQPRPVGRREAAATAALPALRVLVVDDNKDAADSMQMLLQTLGQDAYAIYDGRAAAQAVERLKPHVVMLDIGMPYVSGYDVARDLDGGNAREKPVLVAVTGWGQEGDKQRARESGFTHHFVKPVDEQMLRTLLAEVGAGRAGKDGRAPGSGGGAAE